MEKNFILNFQHKRIIILLVIISSLIIIGAGYFIYKNEEKKSLADLERGLQSITKLKSEQISDWLENEQKRMEAISQRKYLVNRIEECLNPKMLDSNECKEQLLLLKEEQNFLNISLFLNNKKFFISTNSKYCNCPEIENFINSIEDNSKLKLLDFFLSPTNSDEILYGFIMPLINRQNKQVAIIVILIDAEDYIFPLIKEWPLNTKTGETLLFKGFKDSLIFINELRKQKNTALKLKIPLSNNEITVVQTLLGYKGFLSGKDYTNVDVYAYVSNIPETQWYISSEINKSEALASLNMELFRIMFVCVLFIIITAFGLSYLYNRNQKNIYKELYCKEKELWQINEKYQVTLNSLGDGVITTDVEGKVQYLNKIAEKLTEWKLRESKGRNICEIYKVKNEVTNEKENNIVEKVLITGIVKELANHTILETKSGKNIPVVDTGAPIYDNDGKIIGLVIAFKDETEKRQQQKIIAESEKKYRHITNNITDVVFITDLAYNTTFVTPSVQRIFGYDIDEYKKLSLKEKHPQESLELINKILAEEYENEKNPDMDKNRIRTTELEHYKKDGSTLYISMSASFIRDDNKNPIGIQGVARDITWQRKTEIELKSERDRFARIVDTAPGVICMFSIKNKNILYFPYCSPAIEDIFGFTAEDLKDNANFLKENLSVEHYNIIKNEIKKSAASLSLLHCEFLYNHPQKGNIWIENRFLPTVDENRTIVWYGFLIDITERKRAETEFTQLINGMNDTAFVIDFNAKFLDVNETAVKNLGYTKEELLRVGPVEIDSSLDPEVIRNLVSNMKYDEKQVFETSHTTKDGKVIPVEISSSPIRYFGKNAILSIARDISERKKTENQIKQQNEEYAKLNEIYKEQNEYLILTKIKVEESERQFRLLAENAPDAIFIQTEWKFAYLNKKCVELFAANNSDELIGKPVMDRFHKDFHEKIKNRIIGLNELKQEQSLDEEVFVRLDGTIINVETSGVPFKFENKDGALVFVRDITERLKIRNELIKAKERAEESDKLKTAFLQNVSHEIRTPLNGILGFIRLLQEPELSEEEKTEFIGIINLSGKRLLDTINSIIEISKIDAGQMPLLISVVNIFEVMSFFFDFFELAAKDKGLLFEIKDMIPYEKANIYSDKQKIDGIITNLINNAIKFTPRGSIELGNYIDGDMLIFFVKDTGVGIPKDKIDSVFERFVQAEDNITRSFEGAGLGLSIVKAYVEMLNGKIWIDSTFGKGSTFYVAIPYNPVNIKDVSNEDIAIKNIIHKKNIKILIAEDDNISFRFIQNLLQKEGIDVLRTKDGEETVKIVKEIDDIDIILMDVKMPILNGYDATQKIREFNKNITIIAQTAYAFAGDKEIAIQSGCNAHISKPINPDELFSLINMLNKSPYSFSF